MNILDDIDGGCNDYGGRDTDSAHEELEAMAADWERKQNADAIADADEAQAVAAMSDAADADDELAMLSAAIADEQARADAAVAEVERLEDVRRRLTVNATLNAIARGNMNAVDAVTALFGKVG